MNDDSTNELSVKVHRMWTDAKGKRNTWMTLWNEIASHVMTRRAGINEIVSEPTNMDEARLFDTTASQSNIILANGQLSWLTPLGSPWFEFQAPRKHRDNEEVVKWYREATEEVQHMLSSESNFYTSIHECYLDRSGFGTAALMIEEGEAQALRFEHQPIGTYAVSQNHEGICDTVFREVYLTGRQAMEKFGFSNLPKCVQEGMAGESTQEMDRARKYIHAIFPRIRSVINPSLINPSNMPIASVWIDEATKHKCKESGYWEHPCPVTRFLLWNVGSTHPYGWSPSWLALPESRQLNFLQKMLDAQAEKMAFPPILAPEELAGEINPNAGEITYFNPALGEANIPREWGVAGRYDIGKDRVQERQQSIERAFHVDLFRMMGDIDKVMTAREVEERSAEKIAQFSPTFARMTTELLIPMLKRTFFIAYRSGRLPEPPDGLIEPTSENMGELPDPGVEFSSRIALAIKSLHVIGFSRTLEKMAMISQFDPSAADNIDWDKASREVALSDGVPSGWIRDKDDRDKIRSDRQAQMQAQAQNEQMQGAARAVRDVGSVNPESPIADAINKGIAPIPT